MLVVTLPASAAAHPLRFAQKAKDAGADIVEIRGDLTPHAELEQSPLPILLALRGAHPEMIHRLQPAYIDLERDEDAGSFTGMQIIRSYHNHETMPSLTDLKTIADELMAIGCDILKIAVTIERYEDLFILERLHAHLPKDQKRILIGMGDKGYYTRITSPCKNTLTYTFLPGTDKAAPGQLPIHMYRMIEHAKNPLVYGLLGGMSKTKSLSPLIHNALFATHGIDAVYTLFPSDDLEDAFNSLASLGIVGLSVTAPWKRQIIDRLTRLDDLSDRLHSVNTVVREGSDWVGYSTDMHGLIGGYPFLANCKRVAILGSGGVVPAVIAACEDLNKGVKVTVFARNEAALTELADLHRIETDTLEAVHTADFDCVICALGADIPVHLPETNRGLHAIDLRYESQTKFLKTAQSKGYITHGGFPMLVHQALRQFELFTGQKASEEDTRAVSKLVSKAGGKKEKNVSDRSAAFKTVLSIAEQLPDADDLSNRG